MLDQSYFFYFCLHEMYHVSFSQMYLKLMWTKEQYSLNFPNQPLSDDGDDDYCAF